jgi:uncharacterized protein (DUF1800 family)
MMSPLAKGAEAESERPMKQPSVTKSAESVDPWAPYVPSDRSPWNLRRVVHLHRRAGFAATWGEIRRDLRDGPRGTLDRVLAGKAATEGVPAEFEKTADLLGESAATSGDPSRLKAWWVYRMLFGPDPLTERLALMWHNHFATSNLKVADPALMRHQNELFRKLGRAPFGELLGAVVHDPALLEWLDAPSNRKGHPNENLARELMELFSLGIGHYTEHDVKEAARALTGWSVEKEVFAEVPARHDAGEKTILGQTGRWKGDDLVRLVLEHPATSRRLAWRLGDLFLTEKAMKTAGLDALADGLRVRQLDLGWAVETVLRSHTFFAVENLGDRVLSPVEYVIGAARALALFETPCSTLVLADWCARLGQDLFYPPNVGGWPGGRSWLTMRSVLGRANYAAALVGGHGVGLPTPLEPLALAGRHDRGRGRDEFIGFIAELLLGSQPDRDWHARIADAVGPDDSWDPDAARRAIALILTCPEAQLA